MPSQSTRTAGTLAVAGAVLWIAFAASWWIALLIERRTGDWQDATSLFGVAALSVIGAAILTVALISGLRQRHGHLGRLGQAGYVVAVVGAAASFAVWLVTYWFALLSVGIALVAAAVHSRGVAPRLPTIAFGAGLPSGLLLWSVLRGLRMGSPNARGDYVVVDALGLTVGAVVIAVGMLGLGLWLRSEVPRPYEVPRVVSRTVSYGLLTGVLVAAYLVIVSALPLILSPVTRSSPIVAATATLSVAALFQPARRLIQDRVDRRFHRVRYDARRVVESFASSLRNEVSLEAVQAELIATVQLSVHPRTTGLWLHRSRSQHPSPGLYEPQA